VIGLLAPERYERQQIAPDELAQIEAPALLVWTPANPVHGLDAATQAAAALRRGELVVIDDAAQWPQFERPEAFNAAVSTFLADVPREAEFARFGPLDSAERG
jgi:2-hydroxy-6-oxonona-2,4-dienedioate hydrolase